ncbi:potassium channel family protein [Paraburkholderia sp. CNPSo 3274]|uniref:potassium channel family protein n=1 Tax=Paraburkholderia sp. CNPSo 3274 TaxID=2940932 RepID=UPI0020B82AA9|nr:potassium channel family protein [Paraburkholderia sp. CNPSo 3274]MCP3709595.1 potassium channel family protein [Paraburkholderia sp. CNPSo 3274]
MKAANNSAHATLMARHVVAEFPKALWQLCAPIAFLFALYLLLSVVMYNFGGPVDSASGLPCSFGEALYLCAMRAITIGQSDIVPTTSVGHIVSVSLGVLGILLVSTVAAAAVRGVDEAIQNAGTRR